MQVCKAAHTRSVDWAEYRAAAGASGRQTGIYKYIYFIRSSFYTAPLGCSPMSQNSYSIHKHIKVLVVFVAL